MLKKKNQIIENLNVSSVLMIAKAAIYTRKTTPSSLCLTGAADIPTIWSICRNVGVNMKYDSLENGNIGIHIPTKNIRKYYLVIIGSN